MAQKALTHSQRLRGKKLMTLLGRSVPSSGPTSRCYFHLVRLMEERQLWGQSESLVADYKRENRAPSKATSVCRFYYWMKDSALEGEDLMVYTVYCATLKAYEVLKPGTPPIQPADFSGQNLSYRIREWLGDAGNDFEQVVEEYFALVVGKVLQIIQQGGRINRGVLYSPKSLLNSFGWGVFEGEIERVYGADKNYFQPSRKKKNLRHVQGRQLSEIHEFMATLHPVARDSFGRRLSRDGIAATYRYVQKRKRELESVERELERVKQKK